MNEVTKEPHVGSLARRWLRVLTLDASTWPTWCLWALSVIFLFGRFAGLKHSPPGFFSDEFRGALHQSCLSELGQSADGVKWPSFVVGGGGGLYTPPFLYLGALWIKVWGPSIATSRAFVALFGAITVVAITALARRIGGWSFSRYVLLAAALSPWGFQFSRIAWDPPMACAFLVLAVYFWTGRRHVTRLVLSAACLSGALYCYPPTRIQAPLVFLALGLWALYRRSLSPKQIALFAVVCVGLSWKLIAGTLSGELNGRGSVEAIWAPEYVQQNHGRYAKAWFIVQALLDNLHAHFRPSYLFLWGDANLRHSSQWIGQLGYIDILALLLVLLQLAVIARRALFLLPSPSRSPLEGAEMAREGAVRRLVAFSAGAFLVGVLPAALCWSGVPHSLRSIGCWPFLAVLTGYVLHRATRARRELELVILAAALLYSGVFAHAYFVKYPKLSGFWFDEHVQRAMLDPTFDAKERERLVRSYPEAFRYYAIVGQGMTCRSSERALQTWLKKHRGR